MGAAIHGFQWTNSHSDKLERLVREGLPTPIIARRFGCSSTTILARWRILAAQRERDRQGVNQDDAAHG